MDNVVELKKKVELPDSVVEIFCNVQLKSGATWSSTLRYDEVSKLVKNAGEWVELPCLVRRPTGKGEIASVSLLKDSIVVMIDSHDFIDTAGGRPVDVA